MARTGDETVRRVDMSKKPVVLMILDGYGLNEKTEGNAVAMAATPVMDRLMREYPSPGIRKTISQAMRWRSARSSPGWRLRP